MGPDGVHASVWGSSQCMESAGEVPVEWKLVNVLPIYYECMREDPGNYSPLSLTSHPGNIMEKIMLGTAERESPNLILFLTTSLRT